MPSEYISRRMIGRHCGAIFNRASLGLSRNLGRFLIQIPRCSRVLSISFLNDAWEGEGKFGDTNVYLGRVFVTDEANGAKFNDL